MNLNATVTIDTTEVTKLVTDYIDESLPSETLIEILESRGYKVERDLEKLADELLDIALVELKDKNV